MSKHDDKRHYLSEEERAMSSKELQKLFGIARASAWRVKKQGWFRPRPSGSSLNCLPEVEIGEPAKNGYLRQYLTKEERALSTAQLMDKFECSRNTARRIKLRGYLLKGKRLTGKSPPVVKELPPAGTVVLLTPEEKHFGVKMLNRRYGIPRTLAAEALKSGSFEVPVKKELKKKQGPPVIPANYNPENRFFRVNISREEESLSVEKLMELYSFWGLSRDQARLARSKGYFCPNANRPFESKVNMNLFCSLATTLTKEAKKGVQLALKKYFGRTNQINLNSFNQDDLESEALEQLRLRSGYPEFEIEKWRVSVAKYGVLSYLGKEARRRKKEATSVDEIEGRFKED